MSLSKEMWIDVLKDIVDTVMSGHKAKGKLPDILFANMEHCIGLDYKRPYKRAGRIFYKPYRNRYDAGDGDSPMWNAMVETNLARKNAMYHLTIAGVCLLGRQEEIYIYNPESGHMRNLLRDGKELFINHGVYCGYGCWIPTTKKEIKHYLLLTDKDTDALVSILEDEGWIVKQTYGGCTEDGQPFCHKGWVASQKLRETPEWSKAQKDEYERLDAIMAENRNEAFSEEKIEEVCMKKNYELELYKLIMQPDEDDPDISWVDEFGWICGEEFCVWVNLLFLKDFMERFKEIFGSEVFDEGGIHAKIQDDCVCFALEDIMEGYGVELENVFPKDKYKH